MVGWEDRGYACFPYDPALAPWAAAVLPHAIEAMKHPQDLPRGFDCGGTWFVGVDALDNDGAGAIGESGPLTGAAMDFLRELGPVPPLHRAQISGVFPGYPRPKTGEGEAGFNYRIKRDAAHVDGLLPVGPERLRMVKEPHLWILGIPLTDCDERASPLVVWEGSHHIMRHAFEKALYPHPPEEWGEIDLTKPYQAARREVFETCRRVKVGTHVGEACALHRFTLHGVAPWEEGAKAPPEGRLIAYFRPQCESVAEWLA